MGFCGSGDFHVICQHWSAIRAGQVSCGVKSTTAQHININKPTTTTTTTTFGAAGLKTPAVGEKAPPHPCHPIPTWNKNVWDPTGSLYTFSSAGADSSHDNCMGHSFTLEGISMCMHPPPKIAATRGEKTSRPRPRSETAFLHGCPHKPSITTSSSSSVGMDAFNGCSSGKIKAFSTCKCWPRRLDWHACCLIFTPGC